jgi:hypothetical protein
MQRCNMQMLFIKIEAIAKHMGRKKGTKFEIIRTNLEEPVPEFSLQLWHKRGFKPVPIGTAYVRFEGTDKEYTFPLFFELKE